MFILRRQRDNRLDGLLCAPHLYRFTSYNFAAILRPLERKRDVVGHRSQLSRPLIRYSPAYCHFRYSLRRF
jgi:hypothetical protein